MNQRWIPKTELPKFAEWWEVFTGLPRGSWKAAINPPTGQVATRYNVPRTMDDQFYQIWTQYKKPSAQGWLKQFKPMYKEGKAGINSWQAKPAVEEADIFATDIELAKLTPEVKEYLNEFTSEEDLADRLMQLGYQGQEAQNLYDDLISATLGQMPTRKAKGRALESQQKAQKKYEEDYKKFLEKNPEYIGSLRSRSQEARLNWQPQNEVEREALEQFDIQQANASAMQDWLSERERTDPLSNQNVRNRYARERQEGQTANALLRSMETLGRGERTEKRLPPMPSGLPVAEEFLKGTTLGEGTKLRSFIEGQIPDIYRGTLGARKAWWERMNKPEPQSYEEATGALESEAGYWQDVANAASSSETAGNTYYGPGGLKAIAEKAARDALAAMGTLDPSNYPSGAAPDLTEEERTDPFKTALRKRRFGEEYFRQPGAGLANRLTPSVRYK